MNPDSEAIHTILQQIGQLDTGGGTIYVHVPLMRITSKIDSVAGGDLETMTFDLFERIDRDWAQQSYLMRTRPVFWSAETDTIDDCGKQIDTVHNAAMVVTRKAIPSPFTSARYFLQGRNVHRLFGRFDRTLLLNGNGYEPLDLRQISLLRAVANKWHSASIDPTGPIFAPLRGIVNLSRDVVPPPLSILPAIVALEALLVPGTHKQIGQKLADTVVGILGSEAPPSAEATIRAAYKSRNQIVHGKSLLDRSESAALTANLIDLIAAVTLRMANTAIDYSLDPTDIPPIIQAAAVK